MLWPKYCITKVNKVLYYKQRLLPKYCITKENKDVMTKVLYYKSKQSMYYKSKQNVCIVLQK